MTSTGRSNDSLIVETSVFLPAPSMPSMLISIGVGYLPFYFVWHEATAAGSRYGLGQGLYKRFEVIFFLDIF